MQTRKGVQTTAILMLSSISLVLASACSGVSQQDLDAAKQQLTAKTQEAANLQQQLTAKTQEAAAAQQQLQASKTQAQGPDKNVVLFAKPNSPPRATPTPAPPGFVAPVLQPPAAATVPIAFYVDTVTAGPGESKYNIDASVGCARTGVFKRGMHVVWRMNVIDTSTGKVLQGADVERATVKLPNGETVALRYGRHGAVAEAPWFRATGWDIPMDYPLGVLDYTIEVVTKSGKTGTFREMNTIPSPSIVSPKQTLAADKLGTVNAGLVIVE